ncbi:MAG: manganese catalase family protein [Defluviitaleaceae bacterium]|nr:manganese catalase family protein [Defluviitaleaceae bacterium]MCL2238555.1 manganese catalase family protein [Defluviitaleaceae bacterium]
MWAYEKKLQYPIRIKKTDPALAKIIIAQYGGPDGELGASLRYLSQRFTMVTPQAIATLNDIGTEELAHLEIVGSICHQLTANATPQQMRDAGMDVDYVNHGLGIHPSFGGAAWTAAYIQSKGDPITDLYENMAAEQKARSTYEYLLDLIDDPDVADPIKFLREREVVHMQRFGEALNYVRDYLGRKRMFYSK